MSDRESLLRQSSAEFHIVETEDEMGRAAKGLVGSELAAKTTSAHPVLVDFLSGKMRHRLRPGADHEFLIKALGVKKSDRVAADGRSVLVCDFTAGLGTDAFLMAQAGFQVVAFERDPLVFELLQDGLKRFQTFEAEKGLSPIALEFRHADVALADDRERSALAFSLEAEFGRRPHAVVLDPMFEEGNTKSKSKPKKEMAIFREMLRPSSERELQWLLETALVVGQRRVLVKRPVGAEPIAGEIRPLNRREAKTAAYDIYACREVST